MTSLVADIGGTNARFAQVESGGSGYRNDRTLQCKDFPGVAQAIFEYLDQFDISSPGSICLAVAGPVNDGEVKMTNNHWVISSRELENDFPGSRILLINDFTAVASAIPCLGETDFLTIGAPPVRSADKEDFRVAVLGPGTGLGIAGLWKQGKRFVPITSEAGHMGFAPETEQQDRLLSVLRKRWLRVSIERLLSGGGIENIHWAVNKMEAAPEVSLCAEEIFQQAMSDEQSNGYKAVQLFFEILGQTAGDIALAYGASDGIYIAGGMVKRYIDLLKRSNFRQAFEDKGRYRALMQTIPTVLITHPQPGLLGAARYLQDAG